MKKLILFILTVMVMNSAHAMGPKRPAAMPSPSPAPPPSPLPVTKPTLDFGESLDPDEYKSTAARIGQDVDQAFKAEELTENRSILNQDTVDKCSATGKPNETFSDQISYYTSELLNDVPAMVGMIGSLYGTPSNDSAYFPTSLIRHPLCKTTTASLKHTINKIPGQETIEKLNRFASEVNDLRAAILSGDQSAKTKLLGTWSRLFNCLAYTESLSTADSASSNSVAGKVSPTGYRKPAGVKFYEDPAQDAASRLNIGMFQFTPNSGGNVRPCLKAWNVLNKSRPSCQVNEKASQSELIKILGSSLQAFNTFCGVHKVIQTFAIQVNTSKASTTHPENIIAGKLKPQELRCVTPHFQAGRAYNHYGPFQNSTGTNLEKLFSCVERSR